MSERDFQAIHQELTGNALANRLKGHYPKFAEVIDAIFLRSPHNNAVVIANALDKLLEFITANSDSKSELLEKLGKTSPSGNLLADVDSIIQNYAQVHSIAIPAYEPLIDEKSDSFTSAPSPLHAALGSTRTSVDRLFRFKY